MSISVGHDYGMYYFNNDNTTRIVANHSYGFFSNCSVILHMIVHFTNTYSKLPTILDCSNQFTYYKEDKNKDITYEYFQHYNDINVDISTKINYHENHQYNFYSTLDFKNICPLVKKYFSPSEKIKTIIQELESKYNLDYNNICVLFYRGNDKITETSLCNYDEYIKYANLVMEKNPNTIFLIQSDETEFIEYMTSTFPNSFYLKDEIRHMNKCVNTVDKCFGNTHEFSKKYLAITIIMSKCNYIICGSGNCSIWIMFYRGNSNNIYQYCNGEWVN